MSETVSFLRIAQSTNRPGGARGNQSSNLREITWR
jgi:hypothetical protein